MSNSLAIEKSVFADRFAGKSETFLSSDWVVTVFSTRFTRKQSLCSGGPYPYILGRLSECVSGGAMGSIEKQSKMREYDDETRRGGRASSEERMVLTPA